MLPDYPIVKSHLRDILDDQQRRLHKQRLGIFGTIRRHKHFEGDRNRIERADGTTDDNEYKEVTATALITDEDYAGFSQQDVEMQLSKLTEELAESASKFAFARLTELIDRSGHVIDHQGMPVSTDTFFEMLNSVEVDFDHVGRPIMPTIVASPELKPRFEEVLREIENDPTLRARHDDIMKQKWISWRDREADRKLVG